MDGNLSIMATTLPMISTAFIAISAILVAIGWWLIIKRKEIAHRNVMIMGAVAAIIFFILYLTRTFGYGSTPYAGPDSFKPYYLIFLLFHIVLATTSAVFGIVTLTLGFKKRYVKHRKVGRITAVMWFVTAATGITVYLTLYIIYPTDEIRGLMDAIFGM